MQKSEAEKPKKPAGLKLDQGIDLGCRFAVVCWSSSPAQGGSSTRASSAGERHHLALWRADAHGAMEAGMISEPVQAVHAGSRDAPSLDRLTGWHMLALAGSAAECAGARGAAGDFISRAAATRHHLYVDGAKWATRRRSSTARSRRSAARRRDPGGGETAARFPRRT